MSPEGAEYEGEFGQSKITFCLFLVPGPVGLVAVADEGAWEDFFDPFEEFAAAEGFAEDAADALADHVVEFGVVDVGGDGDAGEVGIDAAHGA